MVIEDLSRASQRNSSKKEDQHYKGVEIGQYSLMHRIAACVGKIDGLEFWKKCVKMVSIFRYSYFSWKK